VSAVHRRSVIVPCEGKGHRVRLGSGIRFWRSARCPRCRSAVDPSRWRRVVGWVAKLARPASASPVDVGLWALSLGYLAVALAVALLLWGAGDRWWPATVLLFGPRWIFLLPLLVLVPVAFVRDRALLVPVALAGLVVAGPIVELRTGWRGLLVGDDPDRDVRVATLNARGGNGMVQTASGLMRSWSADIVLFQECAGMLRQEIRGIEEARAGPLEAPDFALHADRRGGLCILSRFPILAVAEMEREVVERAGGSGLIVTWTLELGGRAVDVTNIHLETPRAGFEALRAGRVLDAIPLIEEKSWLRDIELERARRWADLSSRPRIVAGDFNTPPESRAYRSWWGDWTNAFTRVGRGFGGTRLNGWIRVRIDHILVDDGWTVVDARTGEDVGSDHLPVIATIRLEDS